MKALLFGMPIVVFAIVLAWANWPLAPLPDGPQADRVVITKHKRQLALYSGSLLLGTYKVSLGRCPVGAKHREGDQKTPEGLYHITEHKRDSAFHRSLRMSYPSQKDSDWARAHGYSPGSDLMIHGLRNGMGLIGRLHRLRDWTAGCVAVTNPEMDQLFERVAQGAVLEIQE